jgi:signal peptidase I
MVASRTEGAIFFVRSSSMEPSLPKYSFVEVAPCRCISEGEIVVYLNHEKRAFVHRVALVTNTEDGEIVLEVKGDANPTASSEVVPIDQVIGSVKRVIIVSPETYKEIRKWRLRTLPELPDGSFIED